MILSENERLHGHPVKASYVGRFAPSPSGRLHFGSLISALASFLDAKSHQGQWLLRIEDIDPPREEAGASQAIIDSLRLHGLQWDGDILYQSSRLNTYHSILDHLNNNTYLCTCSRPRLLELRGIYDSHCLYQPPTINNNMMYSTRVRLDRLSPQELSCAENYHDLFQGKQQQNLQQDVGDFILKRKDGLIAYQLAVVVDDIAQNITHIIRGSDLLSSTFRQRYLTQQIANILQKKITLPTYGHIPVATNGQGQKLSKQHKAMPIDNSKAFDNLYDAFTFLNHPPPPAFQTSRDIKQLIKWGIDHWRREQVPQQMAIAKVD